VKVWIVHTAVAPVLPLCECGDIHVLLRKSKCSRGPKCRTCSKWYGCCNHSSINLVNRRAQGYCDLITANAASLTILNMGKHHVHLNKEVLFRGRYVSSTTKGGDVRYMSKAYIRLHAIPPRGSSPRRLRAGRSRHPTRPGCTTHRRSDWPS